MLSNRLDTANDSIAAIFLIKAMLHWDFPFNDKYNISVYLFRPFILKSY